MHDFFESDDAEGSSNAAPLTAIKVRKPKQDLGLDRKPEKIGDITERLSALARELDAPEDTPFNDQELPFPPKVEPASQPGWDASSADRRKPVTTPPATNTGWARRTVAPPDILSYWMEIREGQRKYPSWSALEPEVIGKHWPNCILIHCNREVGRLQVKYNFTHAVRKVAYGDTPDEELLNRIEFTPMIIDWILSLGRDVASTRKPTHGTEYFPAVSGEYPLRVIALPLSDNARDIDHVLCYIQKLN